MSLEIINSPAKFLYEDKSSFTDFKYIYDGLDDWADYDNIKFSGGDCTISLWVRLSAKDNRQIFLWDSGTLSYNMALWFLGPDLFVSDDTLSGILEPGGIPLDQDVHITLTFSGGVCNCFVDGVKTSGSPITMNVPEFDVNSNDLTIGSGFTQTMEGLWDQCVIFDRSLNSNEILALYNNGNKVNTDFLRTIQGFVFLGLNRVIDENYGNFENYQVVGNPEEVNYSSKGLFQTSEVLSTWNAIGGDLPARYKFRSDLFPTNEVDAVVNILNVSEFQGRLRVFCDGPHNLFAGNYVTQYGFTTTTYNGVFRISSIINATSYVIDTVFKDNNSGQFVKYYKDYKANVVVYAGLPDYHVLSQDFPITQVGSVAITPDLNNEVEAEITGLIKTFLRENNDLFTGFAPLDYESFIAFYIEYQEVYQEANANGIFTFQGPLIKDDIGGCSEGGELFSNPDFTGGLTDWVQGANGETWIVGPGDTVTANQGAQAESNFLLQGIDLIKGVTYVIQVDIVNPNNTEVVIASIGEAIHRTVTSSTVFELVPDRNYSNLGLYGIYQNQAQPFDGNLAISNFSCKSQDCTTYFWGSNSVQQFQYYLGGNMGEYLVTPGNLGKFLTDFNTITYFKGKKFSISSIISNDAFTNSYLSDNVFIRMTVGNQSVDRKIKNMNDGVYMIGNQVDEDLFESMVLELEMLAGEFSEASIQLFSLPNNFFSSANMGNHNSSNNKAGNPPSDWGITLTPHVSPGDNLAGTNYAYTNVLSINNPQEGYAMGIIGWGTSTATVGFHKICEFTNVVSLEPDTEYSLRFWFSNQPTTSYDPRLAGKAQLLILPNEASTLLEATLIPIPEELDENWIQNQETFRTVGAANYTFSLFIYLPEALPGGTGGALGIDNIELLGPFEQLSESKDIKIDDSCSNQDIHLTWLNKLGGREYFKFTSRKTYSEKLSGNTIKRDIYNNWDRDFIEKSTQLDYINIQSNREITVRSQFVSREQADALWNIKHSLRVQVVNDDDSLTTVIVDKGTVTRYSDGDKLYAIEFKITYPDTIVQNQ